MSRFYITTAIDYVNSRPHLGTAYEKITADVIARYKRLCGVPTHFLMGNDEHSQNVFKRARERGLDPLAYCDEMEQAFRDVWARLEISFDDFIRTTEPRHRVGVHADGRRRIADRRRPLRRRSTRARTACRARRSSPRRTSWTACARSIGRSRSGFARRTTSSACRSTATRCSEHFEEHPEFLQPDVRRNEILRLLEGGLEDISISRAGQLWGIPLPFDPTSVVYVWFDALINYISAIGLRHRRRRGSRSGGPPTCTSSARTSPASTASMWPAMLMSAGLPLPRQVFGHGFVHFKGQKMSKSLGTVLDPLDAASKFGPDPLRLYLVKEIPYGQDGDFSWERFEERYNVDLANNLGNLVNRLAVMIERYRGGRLPAAPGQPGRLASVAGQVVGRYRAAMEAFALHEATFAVFDLVDAANEYIAETEPWTLARQGEQERLTQVLSDVVEAVRIATVLLLPVMPGSSEEILRRMGETRAAGSLRLDADTQWSGAGDRVIHKADPLWPRIVTPGTGQAALAGHAPAVAVRSKETSMTDEIGKQMPQLPPPTFAAEGSTPAAPPAEGQAPVPAVVPPAAPAAAQAPAQSEAAKIGIEEFAKMDLRVAKVLAAEKVKGSKKLIKMQIDVGSEQRTIVAGIAEAYEPETLVGRSIVIVANLKPAKLMGIESNGMVLAASPEGGHPAVLGFLETPPPPGSRVK